ncbi:MAG: ABC transporter permease subunit [Clostridia bacterium]|nr:ABC transporter permease subunit [Clostridia bacterium]
MVEGLAKPALPKRRRAAHRLRRTLRGIISGWQLYLMALPAVILLFIFNYMPMYGTVLAFKKRFIPRDGIWGSPWATPLTRNFQILFKNSPAGINAIRNTLYLNTLFIVVGTVFAIALALAFNEIQHRRFKKLTQSLSFLPYFISTVVLAIFAAGLLGFENGAINGLLTGLGFERVAFFMRPELWPAILLITVIWKGAGYTSVVYLATIAGIDAELYEAAKIDGASRWGEIWYISLPMLKTTIIVLTLLQIGRIMNADFGLFYNVTQDIPTLYPTTDVLDTFIYRAMRKTGDVGISSATALFQSGVAFVLVLMSNFIARRIDENAALF